MPPTKLSATPRRAAATALAALSRLAEHAETAGLVVGAFGYFGGFLLAIEVAIGRLMP